MKKLNFLGRILADTPKKEAQRGKLMGMLGSICGIILMLGTVTAPLGIALLSTGAIAFGGMAVKDASKYIK
jgi:hypothetical protein